MQHGKTGNTLREVYRYVSNRYFPASGKLPDLLLFSQPQWNTWIELTYNQNQQEILQYAQNIISNGFKPGVLMIDDTWQDNYGVWQFHPGRFPAENGLLKNKKNSNNSHLPPSQDQHRPKKTKACGNLQKEKQGVSPGMKAPPSSAAAP